MRDVAIVVIAVGALLWMMLLAPKRRCAECDGTGARFVNGKHVLCVICSGEGVVK